MADGVAEVTVAASNRDRERIEPPRSSNESDLTGNSSDNPFNRVFAMTVISCWHEVRQDAGILGP